MEEELGRIAPPMLEVFRTAVLSGRRKKFLNTVAKNLLPGKIMVYLKDPCDARVPLLQEYFR
ncbi:MAG: hypothetical protein LBR92_02305 [Puniceicoccales bacterium]|jgi:hypothetical protein|nr:hypothetical protein [Puniceicoccales bacterium]